MVVDKQMEVVVDMEMGVAYFLLLINKGFFELDRNKEGFVNKSSWVVVDLDNLREKGRIHEIPWLRVVASCLHTFHLRIKLELFPHLAK